MSGSAKTSAKEALKQKISSNKEKQQENTLEVERQRVQAMTLTALGKEVIGHGQHAKLTCQAAYEEQPKYVIWLMDHQADNVKFQNILTYAEKVTAAKGIVKNSGDEPSLDGFEVVNNAASVSSDDPSLDTQTLQNMVNQLAEMTFGLRQQIQILEAQNQEQQAAIYQSLSNSMMLQEKLEGFNQRLDALEKIYREHLP